MATTREGRRMFSARPRPPSSGCNESPPSVAPLRHFPRTISLCFLSAACSQLDSTEDLVGRGELSAEETTVCSFHNMQELDGEPQIPANKMLAAMLKKLQLPRPKYKSHIVAPGDDSP